MNIAPIAAAKRLFDNRRVRRSLIIAIAAFVLLNGIVYLIYRDRTYPNTTVAGHRLGSVKSGELQKHLKDLPLMPKAVQFSNQDKNTKITTDELGVKPDYPQLQSVILSQRSWLPVANLWTAHNIPVQLDMQQTALQQAVSSSLKIFQRTATDATIVFKDGSFVIIPEKTGQELDPAATRNRLVNALQNSKGSITIATKQTDAKVTSAALKAKLAELNAQIQTDVTLTYADKIKQYSPAEISSWYTIEGAKASLSEPAIKAAIIESGSGFGINIQNISEAVSSVKTAVESRKKLEYALVAAPKGSKTFSYCVATRGVADSELVTLSAKLQSTFSDGRGWGLDGSVSFVPASDNCTFTVWLAAADQMSSFGAICDADWSCAVSPNVILNFDRWRYASSAWNNQGGSLEDYRSMVINHETGHWLGFYHSFCGGAGQQAPVMQQQSIDLQGCSFNPWPTAGERDSLKARLGL